MLSPKESSSAKTNKNKMMSLNDVDFFLSDDNYKHFQSLPPIKQQAIKQIMQLAYLKVFMENKNIL